METITLADPQEVDGTLYKELTLRLPKVKDLDNIKSLKDDDTREQTLMANLCEVPLQVIKELSLRDWHALERAAKGLTLPKPVTSGGPA